MAKVQQIKPQWVKYKDMGGPRYLGAKSEGVKVNRYNPPKPWGVWTQIMGVVARCEGNHDTVVMYDETGVTFGFLQWTFKSGRLQNLLQFLKGVPSNEIPGKSVFDVYCKDESGSQIFRPYGFTIRDGRFCSTKEFVGRSLDPSKKKERDLIVSICMGRRALLGPKEQRTFALGLCELFAKLGQKPEVQDAAIEFAKVEFKQALYARRPPLKQVGGTIKSLLPDEVWGTPIPAIFFNLYQNAPAGSFALFKNAWKTAARKEIAYLDHGGYRLFDPPGENGVEEFLDIVWRRLNRTAYADWGFRSKQYLASEGKNPPRIKRIKPAIEEFYGIKLPYYKQV